MAKLSGLGLAVDLPEGWDGRIYRRDADGAPAGRRTLHAANFALPAERGDYGGGVHERMRSGDVLVTLVEFDPGSTATGLFRRQGAPGPLTPDSFSPNTMPRPIPGQAGAQHFFSVGDRSFSMFVVIGSYADRARLVRRVNEVVRTLEIGG